MFLFLILLISCWVVAASLVAKEANAGVTVFAAENASMYGLKSDEIAALVSACSLVRCCSHQFILPCLGTLYPDTPALCAVSCKALPGHTVDVNSLRISQADIFISYVVLLRNARSP